MTLPTNNDSPPFLYKSVFSSISHLTSDLCSLLSGRPYGWDSKYPGSPFQSSEHSLRRQMMSPVQDGSVSMLSFELICLVDHHSTRSKALQVIANTAGTKFYTAYQLIGLRVVPSVGLILSHATLHVSH